MTREVAVMYHGTEQPISTHDRRQAKGRFSWVKRLMQSQNRQQNGSFGINDTRRSYENGMEGRVYKPSDLKTPIEDSSSSRNNNRYSSRSGSSYHDNDSTIEKISTSDLSNDDNFSTIPMKSVVSTQSTKSPSILSENHQDQASTTTTPETSLAPSVQTQATATTPTLNPNSYQERDSESIVTLASSSRRIRRRSLDTNCSTAGIAPASIMERISGQPTAANSSYAVSIRTNDRGEASQQVHNDTELAGEQRYE